MGFLDNFSFDNLDDPKNQGLLAMGLSMLAPKQAKTSLLGDVGQSGLLGLQALNTAKQQERANRQSDLQQLQGVYSILQNNESMRWAAAKSAGLPYSPSPEYLAVQAKLGKLSGLNTLSAPGTPSPAVSSPLPPTSPAPVAPPAPMNQGFMGANPGFDPSALRAPQAPTPAAPQAPPQRGSGFGGPAGGLDMTDYMMAANNPGLKMYVDQYAKEHAPQNVRPGGTVMGFDANGNPKPLFYAPKLDSGIQPTFGPNGQVSTSVAPGYSKAIADIETAKTGAVEGAKAPFTFQPTTLASGAVVPMSIQQLMQGATRQPAASPQQPAPQPSPSNGVASLTVTQPSRQAQAVPQPVGPDDPWVSLPTIKAPQGIGQTTSQKQLDTLRADKMKALSDQFGSEADVAASKIAQNNQALDLVDHADTGWLASHIGHFRGILGTLGIASASDKAATDEELAKDLVGAAIAKGKSAFTSRFTQGEVNLMLQRGSPSPEMQAQAIKYLLQSDNAQQKYNLQRGMDFGKAMSANGDPLMFNQWYASTFPMKLDGDHSAPVTRRTFNPKTGKIE